MLVTFRKKIARIHSRLESCGNNRPTLDVQSIIMFNVKSCYIASIPTYRHPIRVLMNHVNFDRYMLNLTVSGRTSCLHCTRMETSFYGC